MTCDCHYLLALVILVYYFSYTKSANQFHDQMNPLKCTYEVKFNLEKDETNQA
jgi:hypothetical protein